MRAAVACLALAVALPGAAASFSGRNGLIAFASERDGVEGIFTMHTDGTGLRRLTGSAAPDGRQPVFSPDGRWVAFGKTDGFGVELWVARSDGTAPRPVLREIRQDSASSLDPVWAPDGRSLAYVDLAGRRLGVYVVGLDGRGKRLLVADAQQPHWSRDGRRLAFVRGSGLWVGDASGAHARRIDYGVYPSWAPDGRRIAYVHWRCDSCAAFLAVADVDARRIRRLAAAKDVYGVAWAPDGRRIAFTRCCVDDKQGLRSFTLVDAVSPDGSGRRTLLRREEDIVSLAWSPDGRRLAYDDGYRLWIATVGGAAHLFFRGSVGDFGPIWSPGGSKIYFTRARDGVYTMDARGGSMRRVVRGQAIETLAPDERRFAVSNDADGIDVVTIATGKWTSYVALADQGAGDTSKWGPAWSPRANAIAYLNGIPDDVGSVMLFTFGRSRPRPLGPEATGGLAWSPDAGTLAFESGSALYAFDLRTRKTRLLARNAEQPAWSPDGRRIAFVRHLGRNSEIYVMRSDGSDQRRLTNNRGTDEAPDWQPLR